MSWLNFNSDFIYTGATPLLEDPNDLLQLLFLSHYWRIPALSDSVQCELVGHVSIHTYKDREFGLRFMTIFRGRS